MKIVGVIPARFGSTRFPGKSLKSILDRPLLQWVIEGALTSQKISQIYVATDHEEIAKLAKSCGVEAILTDSDLPSGSDRVWAAIQNKEADVVVNIQGDEPLVDGKLLDDLVAPFLENKNLEMATLGRALDEESLLSSNTAKIVVDAQNFALYFSRYPIPYSRTKAGGDYSGALKHLGLYAYSKAFLKKFCEQPVASLEKFEGLEQLRALHLGAKIKVIKTDHDSWGVDTPEDVEKVEKLIHERKLHGNK